MKVTGPGSGPTADATANVDRAQQPRTDTDKAGKAFSEKLQGAQGIEGAEGPGAVASASGAPDVSDIGAELGAGRITREQAIDKVVGRVLDQQLGPTAPAALRARVESALRDTLASDPVLAAHIARLGSN